MEDNINRQILKELNKSKSKDEKFYKCRRKMEQTKEVVNKEEKKIQITLVIPRKASLKKEDFVIGANGISTAKEIKGIASVFYMSKLLVDTYVQQLQAMTSFCVYSRYFAAN